MLVKAATSIQSDAADGREGRESLGMHSSLDAKCVPGNFTVERYGDALSGVDPWDGLALGDTSATFQTSNQVHHTIIGCMFRTGLKGNRSPHY